jgi:hypothetical protein
VDEEYEHKPEHGHVEPLFAALHEGESAGKPGDEGDECDIADRLHPAMRWVLLALAIALILAFAYFYIFMRT